MYHGLLGCSFEVAVLICFTAGRLCVVLVRERMDTSTADGCRLWRKFFVRCAGLTG